MLGHGNAKGYREYSSMIVRMYLFYGSGPLKSMLNLSNGCRALISWNLLAGL